MLRVGESMKYYYPAIFYPAENGAFIGVVPDLQGCITQGDDLTQAMYRIHDAIGTWLDDPLVQTVPPPSKVSEVDASEYPDAIVNVVEFDTEKWSATLNPIRRAQIAAGLSLKELSELLGAPYRTIQDWVYGTHKPPAWIAKLVVEKIQSTI